MSAGRSRRRGTSRLRAQRLEVPSHDPEIIYLSQNQELDTQLTELPRDPWNELLYLRSYRMPLIVLFPFILQIRVDSKYETNTALQNQVIKRAATIVSNCYQKKDVTMKTLSLLAAEVYLTCFNQLQQKANIIQNSSKF
ncbi:uncharacterized protein LOC144381465 isoform X2 [Halichoerus grypus]